MHVLLSYNCVLTVVKYTVWPKKTVVVSHHWCQWNSNGVTTNWVPNTGGVGKISNLWSLSISGRLKMHVRKT